MSSDEAFLIVLLRGLRQANLEAIIRSKEAANREKDRAVLPMLRATRAVREG